MTFPSQYQRGRLDADLVRLEENLARNNLIGRLYREVQMLRRHIGEAPPFADAACPICFRTFPHSVDLHTEDDYRLKMLPGIEVSGRGYTDPKHEIYKPYGDPAVSQPPADTRETGNG